MPRHEFDAYFGSHDPELDAEDIAYEHWRSMRNRVADTVQDEPLSDPKEPTYQVEGWLLLAAAEAEGEVINIGNITPVTQPIEGERSA